MHLIAPIAETRLKEVIEFFAHPGLKDQRQFGIGASKKAELRRSLNQIISKEVFDANTGLGILATYENNTDQAIVHFRVAYNFSNRDAVSSLNFANSLFLSGNHLEALPVYKNVIIKEPSSLRSFEEICRALIGYGYLSELDDIAKCIKGHEKLYSANYEREIKLMSETLSFLEKINVDVSLFREYNKAMDKVFFKYFNVTTQFDTEFFHDPDRDTFSLIKNLPVSGYDESVELLLGDMNDEFQDEIIKIRKNTDPSERQKIRAMSEKLSFYFSLTNESSIGGNNAT